MPHQFSLYVFRKSVLLRLQYDFIIIVIITMFTVVNLLDISTAINDLFTRMYLDYDIAVAWREFKVLIKNNDKMNPKMMPLMMII